MKKKTLSILSVLIITSICLSGCGKKENQRNDSSAKKVSVKVQQISISPENNSTNYVGTIQESVSIPLSFLTTGTVSQVLVSEGQSVHKGQLIASLNNFSYRNTYQIALAKEKQALDGYKRLSDIYKKGSLPEVKMVEIETGLSQARAATQMARKNVSDCRIYAPTDGVIGQRMIEPGMNVLPGSAVFNLVKIKKVYAVVSIPENEITKTAIGQKAFIMVAALNNETFEGRITEKGVMANPLSHTYEVKIAIQNTGEKLKPGMVSNVLIQNNGPANSIVIPQQSVQVDNNNGKYVFVVNTTSQKTYKKAIKIGKLSGNGGISVINGLNNGDLLVVEGFQKLNENTPVQITE
ncbi:MAG: efflux RND transporter periplasmic adaptor subunit [Bacteroidota bacterium]|nr:efflux RND transporter periplasmic adaptor subunit [Bacteroidota bacterium]